MANTDHTKESILTSVKKMLGIQEDYEHFDPEIIMHINSAFLILNQLGVGPDRPFIDGLLGRLSSRRRYRTSQNLCVSAS